MKILTQETSEDSFQDFNYLPKKVQKKILAKNCENCNGSATSKIYNLILYNLAENGKLVWWHYVPTNGLTCTFKNELV